MRAVEVRGEILVEALALLAQLEELVVQPAFLLAVMLLGVEVVDRCPAVGAGHEARAKQHASVIGSERPIDSLRRMASPLKPDELARYADAMVRVSVALRKDDDLIVTAEPAHRELAAALVEAAGRVGARSAEVLYVDPLVRAARLRSAPEKWLGFVTPWTAGRLRAFAAPTTATIFITGDSDTDALRGIDPKRLATDMTRKFEQLPWLRSKAWDGKRRWSIIAWPTEEWAAQVYPKLQPQNAQRRLAQDLLWFCRLGPDDPPGWQGLQQHLRDVQGRTKRLTQLKLQRLELRGPGTELSVGFPAGTVFLGGIESNAHGARTSANLPTEESFTTPDAASTNGTFRCSRPLVFQGRVVEGIAGEFRNGRLVRFEAKGANGEFFRTFIASVKNADRLGEVALVDRSSRIGQAGRVYYETLLDENAAAHIAFGVGFSATRERAPGNRSALGVNRSDTHIDVMIGTDDFEATGVGARGRRIPLLRDGAWQI
jgi:aminopeptidase